MILDLAFIVLLVAWSAGVGLAILRRLSPVPKHSTDALALAVPLGLGTLALAALGLGQFGWLSPAGLSIVLLLGAGVAVVEGVKFGVAGVRSRTPVPPAIRAKGIDAWLDRGVDLMMVMGIIATLIVALKPVTDGDALCYHVQVPKVFLAAGSVGFAPDLHETVYPLVTEMLYGVGLAFRGPVAARLIQWVLGLVFAASVTALARPMLGRRARWAGAVALLVPAVSNGMSAPLNDVALAAFGNAALLAWVRWYDRPTAGAAALAGVLAGFALGVKYPAIVWTGLLGLAMVGLAGRGWWSGARLGLTTLRRSRGLEDETPATRGLWGLANATSVRRGVRGLEGEAPAGRWRLRHALVFGAVALAVGGAWYLRAYQHTGNPVYPFFRGTFGGSGLDEVLEPSWRPLAVTPWNMATALVPMTLDPVRFDSLSHQFGPAFLMFLPGLIFLRPPRRVVGIVLLGWLFLTLCLTQRQSMRFVLIAVGPLSVGVAWLVAQGGGGRRTLPARVLVVLLLLVLTFEGMIAVRRTRHGLGVLMGAESVEQYLSRHEPTYVVGQWIEANLPADARLIGQDHRGFYIPRPYTMELAHRRRTGLARDPSEPADSVIATLRERGFTHLLMCPPVPEDAVEFNPGLSRALAPWLAGQTPLYRRDLSDGDGVVRAYALYDLNPGQMQVELSEPWASNLGGMPTSSWACGAADPYGPGRLAR